jgi:hypothetical protein
MKFSEFVIECNKNYIDANLALENENIVRALKNRDSKKVIEILHNEF